MRQPHEDQHLTGSQSVQVAAKKAHARVLMIGLDSADADLIDRWCREGYLPTLQSLRQEGTWGQLRTTAEIMHVSAWPSIYTGTLPGKHGMYHAYQIKPGEQDVHRTQADEYGQPPFWKFLDDAGRRCVVMDAFMNYPLEGFRGIQILEYGTWTWFAEPMATPSGLWKEIVSKFGPYPAPEHSKVLNVPEPHQFRQQLIAGAALKAKVVRWLMREQPWDLFFVTFGEPHPAGHYLWHLADPFYPAHPAERAVGLEHAVRDVYVAVDTAIGEILREVDDSVTVIVTSGDGMGPNYAGSHLLPEVLHRLGLYYAAGTGQDSNAQTSTAKRPSQRKSLASAVRDLIPFGVRRAISRCLPRHLQHRLSMKWVNANVDWTKTKAFCIPNANEGYVRLNLQGREPRGIVENGTACKELVAELQAQLRALVNPQNGRPAARQIITIDDMFPGERRHYLPDLVVNWNSEAHVLAELYSDRCGLLRAKGAGYQTDPFYTGNHRPAAFVLARGPQVATRTMLCGGHIVDLAPTLLTMLGVDSPPHMDGRAWGEFCSEPSHRAQVS